MTPAVESAIRRHSWPGNVRELRNVLERAVILADGGVIDVDLLPAAVRRERAATPPARGYESDDEPSSSSADHALESVVGMSLDDVSRLLILETLEATGFNKTRTARFWG